MSFQWDDELLTGDREIDTHHKAFFAKAERFSAAIKLGRGAAELQGNLDFLREYARHHFAAEDLRMTQIAFPYQRSHQEAHDRFLIALDGFQERVDQGEDKAALATEVLEFVVGWLRHHIKNVDFPLIRYLRGER